MIPSASVTRPVLAVHPTPSRPPRRRPWPGWWELDADIDRPRCHGDAGAAGLYELDITKAEAMPPLARYARWAEADHPYTGGSEYCSQQADDDEDSE